MSKTGKQLFEYLPFTKKILYNKIDEIPFKKDFKKQIQKVSSLCQDNYYTNLKKVLQLLNYPGRSYITTKESMCKAIKSV